MEREAHSPSGFVREMLPRLQQAKMAVQQSIVWRDERLAPQRMAAVRLEPLRPNPTRLNAVEQHSSDSDEDEGRNKRWETCDPLGDPVDAELPMYETNFPPVPLDQDILDYNDMHNVAASAETDQFLSQMTGQLSDWHCSVFSANVCSVRIMTWPLPSAYRSMLIVAYITPDTLSIGIYRLDRDDRMSLVKAVDMGLPEAELSSTIVCPRTRRVAVVKRATTTVCSGDFGVPQGQAALDARYSFLSGCWAPHGTGLLLSAAHSRLKEGKIMTWRPGMSDPVSLYSFTDSHVVQIKPSPPLNESHCLCALMKSDFTIAIALWRNDRLDGNARFFFSPLLSFAHCRDHPDGREGESFDLLCHLTTSHFLHAPSVDFSALLDVVVFGGGEVTVWALSSILDESDFLHSFETRPATWPQATNVFRVSGQDASGMFVWTLQHESFAVVNLGTSLGFVHIDSGALLEQPLGQGEILSISRADADGRSLMVTVRTVYSMHVRAKTQSRRNR